MRFCCYDEKLHCKSLFKKISNKRQVWYYFSYMNYCLVVGSPMTDGEKFSIAIFIGIGLGAFLVVAIVGAGVFIYCHQKIIRSRNMILPDEDGKHDGFYKNVYVPNLSTGAGSNEKDISHFFHLDPKSNEYLWAKRVMADSSSSQAKVCRSSCDCDNLKELPM